MLIVFGDDDVDGVTVGVLVGVLVGVADLVTVGVGVGDAGAGVPVGVLVGVAVGVGVGNAQNAHDEPTASIEYAATPSSSCCTTWKQLSSNPFVVNVT